MKKQKKINIDDKVKQNQITDMENLLESNGWRMVAKELDNLKRKLINDIIVGKDENGDINLSEKRNELKYLKFALEVPKLILANLRGTKVVEEKDNYDEFDPDVDEEEYD